ncbi:hypothetical protein HY772_10525 [Candidatus Woesearchaeota archaeon]|nr:hypothetical protein [Candidatus Woesearchaeota archaeon]
MGMFDRLWDSSIACPYCNGKWDIEIQTKDLDRTLSTYRVYYPEFEKMPIYRREFAKIKNRKFIEAISVCSSPICFAIARMRDFVEAGYISGAGNSWYLQYPVKHGLVCGPGKIITQHIEPAVKLYPVMKKRFLQALSKNKEAKKIFSKYLEKAANEFGLAVLEFSCSKTKNST